MENKTKLAELLAKAQVLEQLSNNDIENLHRKVDGLKTDEYKANKDSLLWHTLWEVGDRVHRELTKRAKDDANEAFVTILEHYLESNRVSTSHHLL